MRFSSACVVPAEFVRICKSACICVCLCFREAANVRVNVRAHSGASVQLRLNVSVSLSGRVYLCSLLTVFACFRV